MLAWTIQPLAVWKRLQSNGRLHADVKAVKERNKDVPPAYVWMQKQFAKRLSGCEGRLPWWAHCRKPDLRSHRHLLPFGQKNVRLELELAEGTYLRFPCWAWDCVFRQDFLAFNRAEYERWERRLRKAVPDEDVWPLPEPWRSQLEKSWLRIFSSAIPQLSWQKGTVWAEHVRFEAVFETLHLSAVRKADIFEGRCDRP